VRFLRHLCKSVRTFPGKEWGIGNNSRFFEILQIANAILLGYQEMITYSDPGSLSTSSFFLISSSSFSFLFSCFSTRFLPILFCFVFLAILFTGMQMRWEYLALRVASQQVLLKTFLLPRE